MTGARAVPFGAPKEVNEAQRKICLTAAKLANMQLRKEFLSQNNELTKLLRQSKKKSLQTMMASWSPLVSDFHYGFVLKVRDGDVKWLVKADYYERLEEIVTDSMTQAIMIHQEDWVKPMLNEVFVSEIPYYQISDTPSRVQRIWDRLRGR